MIVVCGSGIKPNRTHTNERQPQKTRHRIQGSRGASGTQRHQDLPAGFWLPIEWMVWCDRSRNGLEIVKYDFGDITGKSLGKVTRAGDSIGRFCQFRRDG